MSDIDKPIDGGELLKDRAGWLEYDPDVVVIDYNPDNEDKVEGDGNAER